MNALIEKHREAIASLCRRYGVRKLEVFGSVLRRDFDAENSDVDVLAEFSGGANNFSNYLDFKEALEALFGRRVDVIELKAIRNRRLRHRLEQERVPIYAAA